MSPKETHSMLSHYLLIIMYGTAACALVTCFIRNGCDVTCDDIYDRVAFQEHLMCCLQVHTLHDELVLCQALDVTDLTTQQVEDAADQQDCGIVEESDSDVMQTYVDQKATISVGLCILHEIFAASFGWGLHWLLGHHRQHLLPQGTDQLYIIHNA